MSNINEFAKLIQGLSYKEMTKIAKELANILFVEEKDVADALIEVSENIIKTYPKQDQLIYRLSNNKYYSK